MALQLLNGLAGTIELNCLRAEFDYDVRTGCVPEGAPTPESWYSRAEKFQISGHLRQQLWRHGENDSFSLLLWTG
jgi:hypothetical protein